MIHKYILIKAKMKKREKRKNCFILVNCSRVYDI